MTNYDPGIILQSISPSIWLEEAKKMPVYSLLEEKHDQICSCSPDEKATCLRHFFQERIAKDFDNHFCINAAMLEIWNEIALIPLPKEHTFSWIEVLTKRLAKIWRKSGETPEAYVVKILQYWYKNKKELTIIVKQESEKALCRQKS